MGWSPGVVRYKALYSANRLRCYVAIVKLSVLLKTQFLRFIRNIWGPRDIAARSKFLLIAKREEQWWLPRIPAYLNSLWPHSNLWTVSTCDIVEII